jgi:hypothetical protein
VPPRSTPIENLFMMNDSVVGSRESRPFLQCGYQPVNIKSFYQQAAEKLINRAKSSPHALLREPFSATCGTTNQLAEKSILDAQPLKGRLIWKGLRYR